MNGELIRIVDTIHRDKSIDKELIFQSIEQALAQAARKHLALKDLPTVKIDRASGEIAAWDAGVPIDPNILGRIAYQQARQIFVQKLREAESDTVFAEFAHKKGDIVTAHVTRYEGPHLVCRLGEKAEATMLKSEQVPGESYRIGERLRGYIAEVEKKGTRIKIYLSRAHEEFVRRLFQLEVPEIADGTVLIKGIAREPGYRTKLTVTSTNDKVDCLGACVGVRGSRIRNVVDELNGENVDIVRWSEDQKELIKNSLKPAEVAEVLLETDKKRATVYVLKNELSQAIGKGGRNVRLASKLTGWEIDIYELGGEGAKEGVEARPAAASADGGSRGVSQASAATAGADAKPAEPPAPQAPADRPPEGAATP